MYEEHMSWKRTYNLSHNSSEMCAPKPAYEFKLRPDSLLKQLRPFYGLPDAGNYCHVKFAKHMEENFGM